MGKPVDRTNAIKLAMRFSFGGLLKLHRETSARLGMEAMSPSATPDAAKHKQQRVRQIHKELHAIEDALCRQYDGGDFRTLDDVKKEEAEAAKPTPELPHKLTPAQRKELLKQRDHGPQQTYGSGRARVQNNLVYAKLSMFRDMNGKPTRPWSLFGKGMMPSTCEITQAGRDALVLDSTECPICKGTKPKGVAWCKGCDDDARLED